MREIKFRAWEKNRKEMLEVLGIFFDVGTIQHKPLKVRGNTNPFNEGYPNTYFRDIELMQYTGLKDKNDIEIYEGDIVKRFDADEGSIIHWRQDVCAFDFTETTSYLLYPEYSTRWYEVIGNIYENPVLRD